MSISIQPILENGALIATRFESQNIELDLHVDGKFTIWQNSMSEGLVGGQISELVALLSAAESYLPNSATPSPRP